MIRSLQSVGYYGSVSLTKKPLLRWNSSKAWMNRHIKDQFVQKSVQMNVRSRAYFKLQELQEKYKIIHRNTNLVIDLGAAPGGWSVLIATLLNLPHIQKYDTSSPSVNSSSTTSVMSTPSTTSDSIAPPRLITIDLLPMEPIPHSGVLSLIGDFTATQIQTQLMQHSRNRKADVIVSDMLSNTTGNKSTDHFRSISLAESVLSFSSTNLCSNGTLLMKILRGEDEKDLVAETKTLFRTVEMVKPKASRAESSEIYLLARGKIG